MSGDRARALKVACPVCAAKPGYRCYAYSQTLRQIVRWLDKPHAARVKAAEAAERAEKGETNGK